MPDASPSFRELVRTFGQIGLINFGGPAGQIALMHRTLVEEKQWIDEEAYLRALNFCHILPGPEAQQLATYIGWKLHGVRGGLAAGLLFILPGAAVVLALTGLYAVAADVRPIAAGLLGVKAAVLAIVVEALLRVARRALNTLFKRAVALVAFVALAIFSAPFPLVMIGAGAVGFLVAARWPALLKLKPPPQGEATLRAPSIGRTLATIIGWGGVWAAPVVLALIAFGPHHVLVEIGLFFAKLASVSFGGAYAVLTYMAQEAVNSHGWLQPKEMVDGLGLAETTPGPLILVTEYVGFLAAYRHPAPFSPAVAGLVGAAMTLWMTFTPCFLWIFAAAPWLQRLEHAKRLGGALAAITAAVVGVIANLTVWFALHVLFLTFASVRVGSVALSVPNLLSVDWRAGGLSLFAAILLFRAKLGVIPTLGLAVLAAVLLFALKIG